MTDFNKDSGPERPAAKAAGTAGEGRLDRRSLTAGVHLAVAGRLHRTIFRELLGVFLVSAVALLSLLLFGRLIHLRGLFLSQNLSFWDVMQLLFFLSPFFMLVLMPISCMLSVFLTFLRMSTDRELVALKAGGLSLYQLLPAPLIFCTLCMGLNFWVSMAGLSWGMDNFRTHVLEFARTKTQLMLQPGVFNRDFTGLVLYSEKVEPRTGVLHNVFVRDKTREDASVTIVAPQGAVGTDSEHGEILVLLRNGRIYRQVDETLDLLDFSTYGVRLDLSQLFRGYDLGDVKPKEMSYSRLNNLTEDEQAREDHDATFLRKVELEKQKRLALPVACLALGLFALPIAAAFQGLRQYMGLLLAMGCFLVYYTLLSVALSLGETGILDPRIGLWLPNAIFFAAAMVGIRFTAQERVPKVLTGLQHMRLPWQKKATEGLDG